MTNSPWQPPAYAQEYPATEVPNHYTPIEYAQPDHEPSPPRRRWPWVAGVAGVAAIAVAFGIGSAVSAPAPEVAVVAQNTAVSQREQVIDWMTDAYPAFEALADAGTSNAISPRAGCAEVEHAAKRLTRHLPSPDANLTAALESMTENYITAAQYCQQLNFDSALVFMEQGLADEDRAVTILEGYLG